MECNGHERATHSAVESDYKEPRLYKQMLKRPEEERNKWQVGVEKEFRDFQRCGVSKGYTNASPFRIYFGPWLQ